MAKTNPNLAFLVNNYKSIPKVNSCLEGSSRSGKTFSVIDFLIYYCSVNEKKTINIIRETYNSFKTTLYLDFARRLPQYHIESNFGYVKDISTFNLFNNQLNFMGADNPERFQGAGCDVAWYNEMLDIPKVVFDQQEQRTREMWIGDWNPRCTDHYIFDLEKRPDCKFLTTTFKDNPFVSENERKKLMGYDPNNPDNVRNGTADDYMWKVYGMGIRAAMEGLIFPNVTWIDKFPAVNELESVGYGLDFGYTNSPTAVNKIGKQGNNLYFQQLFYEPTPDPDTLRTVLLQLIPKDEHIWCDSADPEQIGYLRRNGIMALAVRNKSVVFGIGLMNKFKLHIVRCPEWKKEQENYKWREIDGIKLNEPLKQGYNHNFDACRYYCVSTFRGENC